MTLGTVGLDFFVRMCASKESLSIDHFVLFIQSLVSRVVVYVH